VDADQVRTFLAVAEAGKFSLAADRLNVTQSTVSARIKALEEALGRSLFQRTQGGASLTPAGRQFQRHATTILRAWGQARQELSLPPRYRTVFRLGGPVTLWDRILLHWVPWMQRAVPDVALRLEGSYSASLTDQLADGYLDLAIMYLPRVQPGLTITPLLDDPMLMVSRPREGGDWWKRYIYVDWGDDFRAAHTLAFPEMEPPAVTVGLGTLGLRFVLDGGAAAYLPRSAVADKLRDGGLVQVPGTPVFPRPVFIVHPAAHADPPLLETAIGGLRAVLRAQDE